MDPLIVRIRDFILQKELLARGDRLLMSLSAGKDSMFLLHVVTVLCDELEIVAGIFHLNHMMRGGESDRDEELVRTIGERLGMETHVCRHDFKAGRTAGLSFEEEARNVRYGMLRDLAEKFSYSVIATAHSRDDQVETVLMRILTGTGIHGLQGIHPRRGNIVRPLLPVSAGEIYGYLQRHGLSWREDASNDDPDFTRNYIRNRILPVIRDKFPMADDSVISLSELAAENMTMIDDLVRESCGGIVREEGSEAYIDAGSLVHSYPLFAHLLSSLIRRKFGHHVNRTMLREMYDKYRIERANAGLYADRTLKALKVYRNNKSWIKLCPADSGEAATPEWIYRADLEGAERRVIDIQEIGMSITIQVSDYDFFEKFHKNNGYIFVTLENNRESIYIRNRREGDLIRTGKGTKKIKDLFIEQKLDKAGKERVPLLLAGKTVIACMTGFLFDVPNRIASDFLVDKKSKKVIAVFKTNSTKE